MPKFDNYTKKKGYAIVKFKKIVGAKRYPIYLLLEISFLLIYYTKTEKIPTKFSENNEKNIELLMK